jgi:glycosyltransferase involved in cell wall biosynthesis
MTQGARKKIRIAQVITRLDWSGAPDILNVICSCLDPSQYEITLIHGPTLHPTKKTKEFLKRFSGNVMEIASLKREVSLLEDVGALIKLYAVFRRAKFDIVHTHTAKAGFVGRIAAKLAGAPFVIHTPHGHDFYGYFSSLGSSLVIMLERIASLFADRIAVFTNLEKEDMLKYRICPGAKIEVVPSGIDFSEFENKESDAARVRALFNIGHEEPVVGMVGRLESIKGAGYFIDAARIVLKSLPHTKFLIVGEGGLHESLKQQIDRLKVKDNVILAGWRDDIPAVMSALDILVLTSLNEAVGRVILEAAACGKPSVATAVGGIPDIIKDKETGILIPPMDPVATASAIIGLLKDAPRRLAMGRAAMEWARKNFDSSRMVSKIDSIYKEAPGVW